MDLMNPLRTASLKGLRKLNSAWKARRKQRARREFEAVLLQSGDLAIDCGANIGEITLEMARNGAEVHAFEPNPQAMAVLREKVKGRPAVHCHAAAVSDHDGQASLYLHRKHDVDPMGHSAGSSLVGDKHNLDPDRAIQVPVIDIARFIRDLDRPVKLLKIDIEGLEARLLNHLLDQDVLDRIEHVFCETHEFKVPGLWRQCRALRRRLAASGVDHVNLDWA